MKLKNNSQPAILNRKARYDFHITSTYIAGMVLSGVEVASLREGRANISDTYVLIKDGEVWIRGMSINRSLSTGNNSFFYNKDSYQHDADRKLLLTKKQIRELIKWEDSLGHTIIPLKLFRNDKGLYKLEIGLAVGKKEYDKREAIKDRDNKRTLDSIKKDFNKYNN